MVPDTPLPASQASCGLRGIFSSPVSHLRGSHSPIIPDIIMARPWGSVSFPEIPWAPPKCSLSPSPGDAFPLHQLRPPPSETEMLPWQPPARPTAVMEGTGAWIRLLSEELHPRRASRAPLGFSVGSGHQDPHILLLPTSSRQVPLRGASSHRESFFTSPAPRLIPGTDAKK